MVNFQAHLFKAGVPAECGSCEVPGRISSFEQAITVSVGPSSLKTTTDSTHRQIETKSLKGDLID